MITLFFYFVWKYFLDKDDEIGVIGIPLAVLDGIFLYAMITDLLTILIKQL